MTHRTKVLVAAGGLLVIYNLNLRAIESRDTRIIEHVALSIAATGDADLNEFSVLYPGDGRTDLSGDTVRVGGHVRGTYPIVTSLTAAPFFWVAIQTGLIDPERPRLIDVEAVAKVAASCWTALACLVLSLLVSKMAPDAPTVPIMLAAGVATPLWSSAAQALWSHGPAACFLSLGFLLMVAFRSVPVAAIAAGMALGLAVSCRPLLAVFPASTILAQLFTDRERSFRLAVGCAAVLAAVAAYHLWIFGAVSGGLAILEADVVHRQTHRVDSAWSGNPIAGLAGILISPSRGILIFAPIACLVWPAIRAIWNRDRFLRWLLVVPTLLFLLVWSKYAVWWGGHSYGPRYAADLVVPITAIIACGWHRFAFSRSKLTAAATAAALIWSIGVQAIGVYCYPNGDWNGSPVDVDHAHARLWDWNDSQIVRSVSAGWYRPRWLQQRR